MFFLFVSLLFLDFKRKRAESRAQINTLKLKHNADAQISHAEWTTVKPQV